MDGNQQCILPKLPLVRRNVTAALVDGSIPLPAPCWTVGAMPLVYVYFGIGLSVTMTLIFYGQFDFLRDLIAGRFRTARCSCTGQPPPDDNATGSKAEELGVDQPAVDRLIALSEAKAKRSRMTVFLAEAATAQTTLGQILMGTGVVCSGISLMIYLAAVSNKRNSLEMCGTMPNVPQMTDFLVNAYLLFYYVIRVAGSEKRQATMTSMMSVVDYFTIPGVLLSAVLDRYFTGFNFFRAYNFLWLLDILAYRRIVKSVSIIRMLKLVMLVLAIILIAAGFLHVVENMGDPWLAEPDGTPLYNGQSIAFWRCFFYVYGRITLLDLSGMRMHTMMGRVIIYGFQILALSIVMKAIPQIMMRLKIKPDYDKAYAESKMFIHVIVCGHVTAKTMESFLQEFYHPDRDSSEFYRIVVLSEQVPDEEMGSLQERYFSKLDYFKGSVMVMKDLNRVRLSDAKATLILADRTAPDVDADDAANIMRVVSVKNYKYDAQVIVQLSQYHNKAFLQNIPSWNPEKGDIVICLAELRLGLLAQSCIAPGFSSLMANFFTTRSFDENQKTNEEPWMKNYRRGTALELYCRPFSDAFDGMSFPQACEFCYSKLKILLLAIQINPTDPLMTPQINPPPHVTIDVLRKTVGYFVADNATQVDRAQFYCTKCHLGVEQVDLIRKCDCQPAHLESHTPVLSGPGMKKLQKQTSLRQVSSIYDDEPVESKIWSYINQFDRSPKSHSVEDITKLDGNEAGSPTFDSTGMFYWVPSRSIEDVTISRKEAATAFYRNHIVVCVLSQEKSQICGLSSFVPPLRSSVIKPEDLQDIILLGDPKYLEKEWKYLNNMPKVFVVKGTALNRSDLRSVNLNTCAMCVILGTPAAAGDKNSDPTMADKSVILATLNVRAMKFSEEECPGLKEEQDNDFVGMKQYADKVINRRKRKHSISQLTGYDVPLITDLVRDSNVQFLDDRDEDLPGTEFYLSQPYIGGSAFTASVLDLLMVTCFFNPTVMKCIHTIIFGGASLELERIMAEGAGLIGGAKISQPAQNKNQVSVDLVTIKSSPLGIHVGSPYGGLVIDALRTMGLVVLGIYRPVTTGASKRYVICNPPETFIVEEDDQVYALHRANSVIQPVLRTRLNSNQRRLVDTDVQSLEKNLNALAADVSNTEQRFLSVLHIDRPDRTGTLTQEEESPLLGRSENRPLRPAGPSFATLERRGIDEELRIMEQKLARMKQDIAFMQERYVKFAFGDYT
ncbi:Calcium-activated potassium channel subunit alpha-1 [Hypsibius exemplaris]|uniref:Calcium-activated potassium channel subunit alpha-1 n=1 Tax=Hypsibius exemplaris TaxID=2072580 RepID=A0A1W0WKV5_HYPEX|nr:Calcium-activated potassium channel subunit alpha-1 [Hypsibius exemplaris]